MATRPIKFVAPPPPDRRTLPKDAGEWVRGYVPAVEDVRRETLAARQQSLAAEIKELEQERAVMAKQENVPPMVLAMLDGAIASTRHDAETVEATLQAIKTTPPIETGGYAVAGTLATAAGKGPADGTAALFSGAAGAARTALATTRVAPDGSLCLVLDAKTAKQFAGQPGVIELTVAGKPVTTDAKVTIAPGQVDVVRLPFLADGSGGRPEPDIRPVQPGRPIVVRPQAAADKADKTRAAKSKAAKAKTTRKSAKKTKPKR
jgi:hypothetical protein